MLTPFYRYEPSQLDLIILYDETPVCEAWHSYDWGFFRSWKQPASGRCAGQSARGESVIEEEEEFAEVPIPLKQIETKALNNACFEAAEDVSEGGDDLSECGARTCGGDQRRQ